MEKNRIKKLNECYLYQMNLDKNNNNIKKYIMDCDRMDKSSPSFNTFKTYINSFINSKIIIDSTINSNNVVITLKSELPPAFNILTVKDIKNDNKYKIFLNLGEYVKLNDKNEYTILNRDIDKTISLLYGTINHSIYFGNYKKLIMKPELINSGAELFSSLYLYILNYLYKINHDQLLVAKIKYLTSKYFISNILNCNPESSRVPNQLSRLSERQCDMIDLTIGDYKDVYKNIKVFNDNLSKLININIRTDLFIEKWAFVLGVSTYYALEFFPIFATMISNVYVGSYMNNQKTIEKICSPMEIKRFVTIIQSLNKDISYNNI